MLTTLRSLFTLRRDERWLALVLLAPLVALQALMVYKFSCLFAHPTDASWVQFMRNFRMSGFDPTTYAVVLHWYQGYDILRHPLLALFVWPLSMLNAGLSALMGTNCVQLVVGVVLIASAFYALLWLWRTLRFVVGVGRCTAWLLTLLFMGFGMIAVTVCVPDHFCLSLTLLSLTLYVSGLKLKQGTRYSAWQAIVLFVLTAGVTLSNGIIVLLAIAITNGRAAFRPHFFLGALVLPACLMLAAGMGQRMMQQRKVSLSAPVAQQMKWTRHDVSRADVLIENFLGESLQLHRRHILGDVLSGRPIIVRYSWTAQYVAEAIIVLLALAGAWVGRRQRFQWLLMAVLGFNVLLHIVLGFAIDEVHIMAAHWALVLPLSMGWLLRSDLWQGSTEGRCRAMLWRFKALQGAGVLLLVVLVAYLWMYHGTLLYRYLTRPLVA